MTLLLTLLLATASAHQGHTSSVPWDACDGQSLGDTCSFEPGHDELHVGSCRAMSGDLVCVRNQPIAQASSARSTPAILATLAAWGGLSGLVVVAFGRRLRSPEREIS